jgi:hypothetical protein
MRGCACDNGGRIKWISRLCELHGRMTHIEIEAEFTLVGKLRAIAARR